MIHRFAASALLACALVVPLSSASARRDVMVEYTCPIDGQKFQSMTPMSGTSFGARLDGRRIGPIAVPYPYPACPGNGFVLYRDSTRLDADYIAKAKALVETEDYRRVRGGESKHFLAAWIAERMGEEPPVIVGLLREAAWDAEGRGDRHTTYLRAAATKLSAWQASQTDQNEGWLYRQILLAELLRQAGDFGEGRRVLDDTPRESLNAYVDKHPVLKEMVAELRRRIDSGETLPISPPRT
jgi:hypothetical protein